MPAIRRLHKMVFIAFGFILINCAFIQGLWQPPAHTPAATASNTPVPTDTPTQSKSAFPTAEELIGTRWTLLYDAPEDGRREYDIIFLEGRRLQTFHPNDNTPENDTWKLVGSQLTMSMNNGFAIYIGDFIDSDTIAGTAKNSDDESWEWTAYRKAE